MAIKQLESSVQQRIVNYFRYKDVMVCCTDMSIGHMFLGKNIAKKAQYNKFIDKMGYHMGQSDLMIFKNGITVFVEVKTWQYGKQGQAIGKTKQRPDQIRFQEFMERHGFKYLLIDSPEKETELYNYINSL